MVKYLTNLHMRKQVKVWLVQQRDCTKGNRVAGRTFLILTFRKWDLVHITVSKRNSYMKEIKK